MAEEREPDERRPLAEYEATVVDLLVAVSLLGTCRQRLEPNNRWMLDTHSACAARVRISAA